MREGLFGRDVDASDRSKGGGKLLAGVTIDAGRARAGVTTACGRCIHKKKNTTPNASSIMVWGKVDGDAPKHNALL